MFAPGHTIDEIRSPVSVILRCTCGWRLMIRRRQNRLARAAQVRAAIRQHEREADEARLQEGMRKWRLSSDDD